MLDHVKHVEAVAVMRGLLESPGDPFVRHAAERWLGENHPPPKAYMAAMTSLRQDTPAPTTSNGEGQ